MWFVGIVCARVVFVGMCAPVFVRAFSKQVSEKHGLFVGVGLCARERACMRACGLGFSVFGLRPGV